ncbi:MAG: type II toxin-antitoxin system VapC family toxin [Desulfuromonadales bacterium]|nr:type II toxin-antitoxin system VapC family toxin [Desulfuromonadales bacterium]
MLILDTCALIFDALDPDRLSKKATTAIIQADAAGKLACCDISFWEIAMRMAKGRLDPGTNVQEFIELILAARKIVVIPTTPEIAVKSALAEIFPHNDPADRLIAATTLIHKAKLVTSDLKLATIPGLQVIW